MLLWVGCVAGAVEETDYLGKLTTAGFEHVSLEPTRVYETQGCPAIPRRGRC